MARQNPPDCFTPSSLSGAQPLPQPGPGALGRPGARAGVGHRAAAVVGQGAPSGWQPQAFLWLSLDPVFHSEIKNLPSGESEKEIVW